MCISVSGRCFLSKYSTGKSANRGECLQPCRREYVIKDKDGEFEYIVGEDYIMSPKDLCTIDFIDELIISGVDAFKIEGRMRPPEYVKVVTSVYRRAIDNFFKDSLTRPLINDLKDELYTVYTRGFSCGFYFGKPADSFSRELLHTTEKKYLGYVKKIYKKIKVAEVLIQNGTLRKNDILLFVGKNTPALTSRAIEIQKDHSYIDKASKSEKVGIKLPFIVRQKDKVFILKRR